MERKKEIGPKRWTPFWKSLGVVVRKRQLFLQRYKPNVSDIKPLVRLGVDRGVVEKVYGILGNYADPLVFHNFCSFFRKDPETIRIWTDAEDFTEAFERLYHRFARHSLADLRTRFGELRLLSEYNQKGEGRRYQIRFRRAGSVPNINGTQFTPALNRNDPRSRYEFKGAFAYGGATIICILKRGSKDVYKFIKVKRQGSTIDVVVSADSKAEYGLIRRALQQYFRSYVDSPQSQATWDALRAFLRGGASDHFQLVGVTYSHDDFHVSVRPRHRQITSVSQFNAYRRYLQGKAPERVVISFRISNVNLSYRQPIAIDVMTSDNSDIIGAILLQPQDRRLNSREREILSRDFEHDFGISLATFVSYDDLATEAVYQRLLQTIGRKSAEVQLRSDIARDVFKNLESRGIIEPDLVAQDVPHYCTNRQCRIPYEIQRGGRRYCESCGDRLLPGQAVLRSSVNEQKVAQSIVEKLAEYGEAAALLKKKLLNRNIYIASITLARNAVEIIPIAGRLSDNQIALLHLRYPNALVLTSQDNVDDYSEAHIECRPLFDFLHLIDHAPAADVMWILNNVISTGLQRVRTSVHAVVAHYRAPAYYRRKNGEKRNLGAELFEAHTHLIWAYMFKNSTWLGATQRGKPLPDGISALPVVRDRSDGCILWDSKYSDGDVKLGSIPKNSHYIISGRQNETIRHNGGVGGFIFVGTQPAPANFSSRYKRLGGPRKPKIVYMTSDQLLKLYHHFVVNEADLSQYAACYRDFMDALYKLLISTAGGAKAVALDDAAVDEILAAAELNYHAHRTPAVTA